MEISQLENKTIEELAELAKEMGITNHTTFAKQDIIMRLLQASAEQEGDTFCNGILETMTDGYGFLRNNFNTW